MAIIDRVTWHKSSYSNGSGGACVEVAALTAGHHAVRDSKDPAGTHLMFTSDAWTVFTAGVRDGEFD